MNVIDESEVKSGLLLIVKQLKIQGLIDFITSNSGNCIQFENGCWLNLKEDNGIYWGEDPYGIEWGCNSKNHLQTMVNWISFWDEPRNEKKEPILNACFKELRIT